MKQKCGAKQLFKKTRKKHFTGLSIMLITFDSMLYRNVTLFTYCLLKYMRIPFRNTSSVIRCFNMRSIQNATIHIT